MGVGGGERSMEGGEGKEVGNEEGNGGEKISGGIVQPIFSFVEVLLNQIAIFFLELFIREFEFFFYPQMGITLPKIKIY